VLELGVPTGKIIQEISTGRKASGGGTELSIFFVRVYSVCFVLPVLNVGADLRGLCKSSYIQCGWGYGFNLKSADKKLTDNKISYPQTRTDMWVMKLNKYKNKSLEFPHFPQLLSPSPFPPPSSLHCSECPASPTVDRRPRLSYCRSSSLSLLQPRSAAGRLSVAVSRSPECPSSPTAGRRPRLSSTPDRSPVIFQSPSAIASSAPLLLLSIVIPVSPTAGCRPRLSSSPDQPLVVFQSQPLLQPSPLLQALQATVPPPAGLQIEALQASCVQPPWGHIRSLAFLQNPVVAPLPAASVAHLWSKLLLPVQVAAIGPSCCRRSKLLPPPVQATAVDPSCYRSKLLLSIQAAYHRLQHRSIDSCGACAKSFVRT
jgi:hypothetical protein